MFDPTWGENPLWLYSIFQPGVENHHVAASILWMGWLKSGGGELELGAFVNLTEIEVFT